MSDGIPDARIEKVKHVLSERIGKYTRQRNMFLIVSIIQTVVVVVIICIRSGDVPTEGLGVILIAIVVPALSGLIFASEVRTLKLLLSLLKNESSSEILE